MQSQSLFRTILLGFLITFLSVFHTCNLHAQDIPAYQDDWITLDFDECNGTIEAEYVVYYDYEDIFLNDQLFLYSNPNVAQFGVNFEIKVGDQTIWNPLLLCRITDDPAAYPNYNMVPYTAFSVAVPYHIYYLPVNQELYDFSVTPIISTDFFDGSTQIRFKINIENLGNTIDETIHMRLNMDEWTYGGGVEPVFDDVTIAPQVALSSFNATNNTLCDRVDLEWTNPINVCSNSKVVIERNNGMGGSNFTEIAQVPYNNSPYPDFSAIPGVEYTYRAHLSNQMAPTTPEGTSESNGTHNSRGYQLQQRAPFGECNWHEESTSSSAPRIFSIHK